MNNENINFEDLCESFINWANKRNIITGGRLAQKGQP